MAVASLEMHSFMKGMQLAVHSLFIRVSKKLQNVRREMVPKPME